MTQVRFAQLSDIPAMVELGRQIHVQSRYGWMMYSASQTWKYLERVIPAKQNCVIVAVQVTPAESTTVGVLVATARQYPFSTDLCAHIDYLYVTPPKRGTPVAMKLVTAFRRWANNREVAEITITNQFGPGQAQSAKLFTKLGMPSVGGQHSMWVQRK
ncbi:MAG: GNAT family N-acetyltransferase [Polaromonas sp.]